MVTILALLLSVAAPESRTAWMQLESFHLAIGMPRQEALAAVRSWGPKQGRDENEVVIDYDGDKALTLQFKKDRLQSARFELFVFLPEVRGVFDEKRLALRGSLGEPPKATRSILIYDDRLPNVMVVVADDPKSEPGQKGLGVLAVRYYDPR